MAMEALKAPALSSFPSIHRPLIPFRTPTNVFANPILHFASIPYHPVIPRNKSYFKTFTAVSPTAPSTDESFTPEPEQDVESTNKDEKFDWYANWYPVVPICDLDKRRPHGRTVIGIDVVVWYDRNESAWKVFDDSCPHRRAPLSEGRIDQWGRLQCVYHGWCFGGSGDCKLIPQAPRDGPP